MGLERLDWMTDLTAMSSPDGHTVTTVRSKSDAVS
jgi:hypothetical protein